MSYILDALKKSAEERRRARETDLLSLDSPPLRAASARKRRRPLLLLLLLLLPAIAVTAVWLGRISLSPKSIGSVPTAEQPDRSGNQTATADQTTPANPAGGSMTATSTAASTQQAPSTAATTMTVDSTFTIPELKGLPLSLQAVIPEVKFSGHVYSPEPSRRMIMANQAVVREQDLITPETRLEEITETGVLLNYRGTRFRVELLPPL